MKSNGELKNDLHRTLKVIWRSKIAIINCPKGQKQILMENMLDGVAFRGSIHEFSLGDRPKML